MVGGIDAGHGRGGRPIAEQNGFVSRHCLADANFGELLRSQVSNFETMRSAALRCSQSVFFSRRSGRKRAGSGDIVGLNDVYRRPSTPNPRCGRPPARARQRRGRSSPAKSCSELPGREGAALAGQCPSCAPTGGAGGTGDVGLPAAAPTPVGTGNAGIVKPSGVVT